MEENGGEDGLLAEVIEGRGDKQKITAKAVKVRLKEIGNNPFYTDERSALQRYEDLLRQQSVTRAKRKVTQEGLDQKIDARYLSLTEAEVKTLVVDDKWMVVLSAAAQSEIDRISQTLTVRIHQLAKRYADTLPQLERKTEEFGAKVEGHFKNMGLAWE